MSRSYRRNPCSGFTTCRSEVWDKYFWHHRFRQAIRKWLHKNDLDIPLPHMREVSNVWMFGKDGKSWWVPKDTDGLDTWLYWANDWMHK